MSKRKPTAKKEKTKPAPSLVSKKEFIAKIQLKLSLDNLGQAEEVLDAINEIMVKAMIEGRCISLSKIGRFSTKNRPARKGRNPRSGETIDIAAKNTPVFKPCLFLKEIINE